MKKSILWVWLSVLLGGLLVYACSQEKEFRDSLDEAATLPVPQPDDVGVLAMPGPAYDCEEPLCEDRMPSLKRYYQLLANSTGQTIRMRVPCCYLGTDIWVTLEVFPEKEREVPDDCQEEGRQ